MKNTNYTNKIIFTKNLFTPGNVAPFFSGYHNKNYSWNGFAAPAFTFEEALKIQTYLNQFKENYMTYNPEKDEFKVLDLDFDCFDIFTGENYLTEDGIKHLYSIGSGIWTWCKAK